MEVINYLVGYKDLKIVQNTEWFNFSLDSVLLAKFITIRNGAKKIIDLGTGNAPIPLILSTRSKATIYGIEIQEQVYNLAVKSIKLNNLDNQIKILNNDVKNIDKVFETDSFDAITSNPPYFKVNDKSLMNDDSHKTIARHEVMMNIEDILRISKKLLKNGGVVAIVHRPERLMEILDKMRKYNLEPKRIRFIYPKENSESNMVLIEGAKNGREGLKILPPLFVHDSNGNYTEEVRQMFGE